MTTLAAIAFVLAAIPVLLYVRNALLFRRAPTRKQTVGTTEPVSVLIPARNEEHSIGGALQSVLQSDGVALEVIVLDDQSDDRTAAVVRAFERQDERVRLLRGKPLRPGWCGKQYACWQLARAAACDTLVFLDADVRVTPDCLARSVHLLHASGIALLSGFPRQLTGTLLERLLIPLIHFVLLGFLPIGRMRRTTLPQYAAGCGQLFITRREAYFRAGGHWAIRASLHDGMTLPRAYREANMRTDLFDASDIAVCRMYTGARQVWRGLSKNAVEGLAHPARIVPATILLAGGQILPLVLLASAGWTNLQPAALLLAVCAVLFSYLPRGTAAIRFDQSLLGVWLHPLSVGLLLLIQWNALLRHACGIAASWKGRTYGKLLRLSKSSPAHQ
jgi:hypothetical protein